MSHAGSVLVQAEPSAALLTELDSRDTAVWLLRSFIEAAGPAETAQALSLPWAFVLSESSDPVLIGALEASEEPPDAPLVRRRGMIHVIDTNPSDVTLPPRSLPVFLLNGRSPGLSKGFAAATRRQTMIQELQRRSVTHLVILTGPNLVLPAELDDLWADGFRTFLTIVSDDPQAESKLDAWRTEVGAPWVGLVPLVAAAFINHLVQRYTESRDDRLTLRLRDAKGALQRLDVTGVDDPEHPLLGRYELLSENPPFASPARGSPRRGGRGIFQGSTSLLAANRSGHGMAEGPKRAQQASRSLAPA